MKKVLFLLFSLFFYIINGYSQIIVKYDTVIDKKIYKSYYSYTIKAPSFVIYKLYRGGGQCSRKDMNFKSKFPHFDYAHSKIKYDKGHLANAEDFAYDCDLERITFDYVNAIPQTPKLNRGTWKSLETKVRKASQNDSLLIICGGSDWNNKGIPLKCFKIVYSLSTHKMIFGELFNNDNKGLYKNIPDAFYKEMNYNKIENLFRMP